MNVGIHFFISKILNDFTNKNLNEFPILIFVVTDLYMFMYIDRLLWTIAGFLSLSHLNLHST